jgi:hypothetical protein
MAMSEHKIIKGLGAALASAKCEHKLIEIAPPFAERAIPSYVKLRKWYCAKCCTTIYEAADD